jgi:hypothetical protein
MAQDGRGAALAVVAGAGLLLGGAGAAHAGQSLGFSVQHSTNGTQTLDFGQFDTALGTLTEVDVLLSGSVVGDGSQISLTGGEGSGVAGFTASLDLVGPNLVTELSGMATASASCNTGSAIGCSSGLNAPALNSGAFVPNPATITAPALLLPFEGTGTVGLSPSIDDFTLNNNCSPNSPFPATCVPSNDVSWAGTITLSYKYEPASGPAVPEPASVLLLGTGLAALARARRRAERLQRPAESDRDVARPSA